MAPEILQPDQPWQNLVVTTPESSIWSSLGKSGIRMACFNGFLTAIHSELIYLENVKILFL